MVDVSSEFKTEYAFKLLDGYDDVWVFVDKAFKNSKGRGGDWFAVNEEGEQLDSVLQVDQLRNGDWEKWEWEV